jgi:hypothetical protein
VLVAASVLFYVWGARIAIVLVLLSVTVNFALGQAIAAADPVRRHRLISWSVAGNLLVLIIFKYTDFIIENINSIIEPFWNWRIPAGHSTASRNLVFHVSYHFLSGGRLSWRCPVTAFRPRVHALHH